MLIYQIRHLRIILNNWLLYDVYTLEKYITNKTTQRLFTCKCSEHFHTISEVFNITDSQTSTCSTLLNEMNRSWPCITLQEHQHKSTEGNGSHTEWLDARLNEFLPGSSFSKLSQSAAHDRLCPELNLLKLSSWAVDPAGGCKQHRDIYDHSSGMNIQVGERCHALALCVRVCTRVCAHTTEWAHKWLMFSINRMLVKKKKKILCHYEPKSLNREQNRREKRTSKQKCQTCKKKIKNKK